MRKTRRAALWAAALALAVSAALTLAWGKPVRAENYGVKLAAAQRMEVCMDRVRDYKAEMGLALSPDDLHRTGLIGEPYTGITTTSGALEAKRTTANSDMAALAVQLLEEAGVGPGDRVGAAFSGSFPGMDLAVLCACAAMDVEVQYISSVGASTYGANQPELTFPDMAFRLSEEGLLPRGVAVSMGGQDDLGLDMDPALRRAILARLEARGERLVYEEDYAANLALRQRIYEEDGPISCFIGVGGNLTTSGLGENGLSQRFGVIPPYQVKTAGERSGLLEVYNARGLPVIHLLNIKRLVAGCGLPYDPAQLPPPGESAIYWESSYPKAPSAAGLVLAGAALLWGRRKYETET